MSGALARAGRPRLRARRRPVGGVLAPLFNPSDLTELLHWWDFSDAGSVYENTAGTNPCEAGDGIANVTDKGSAAEDLTQGTPGDRAVWTASVLNGQSGARFNGAGDCLSSASGFGAGPSQPIVVYVVYSPDVALHQWVFDITDGAGRTTLAGIDFGGDVYFVHSGSNLAISAPDANAKVVKALYDGTSSELWEDDVSQGSGDAGTNTFGDGSDDILYLGCDFNGANTFDGDILELLVMDAELSAADEDSLYSYFTTRYGVP